MNRNGMGVDMSANRKFTSKIASSIFAVLAIALMLAAGARPAVGQACTGQTWNGATPTVWAAEGSIKVLLNNDSSSNAPNIPIYSYDGNFNPAGYTGATAHPPITELNPVYSCPGGTPTIALAGAGNETVSFQVFITAGTGTSAALSNVTVDITSTSGSTSLTGSNGGTLTSFNTNCSEMPAASMSSQVNPYCTAASNINRFLEGYLPSYTYVNPATVGWGTYATLDISGNVPDPLIPFYDPYDSGNPAVGAVFNVQPGTTQAVWVDVSIPAVSTSQPAGFYSGTVTVKEGGTTLASIPINLTVWNGNLPGFEASTIPANMATGQYADMLKTYIPLSGSEFHNNESPGGCSQLNTPCPYQDRFMWEYQLMGHDYDFDTFIDNYAEPWISGSYPSTNPTSFTTGPPNGPGCLPSNGCTSTIDWNQSWANWDAYYGPSMTPGGLFADGTNVRVFDTPVGTGGNGVPNLGQYPYDPLNPPNTLPPPTLLQLYQNYAEQISQHFTLCQTSPTVATCGTTKPWGHPELIAYDDDEPYAAGGLATSNDLYNVIAQYFQALNQGNTALSPTWDAKTNPIHSFLTDDPACQTQNDSGNYQSWSCTDHVNLSYPGGINGGGVSATPDANTGNPFTSSWVIDWSDNPALQMVGAPEGGSSQPLYLFYTCGVTALTAGTDYVYTLDTNPADKGVITQSSAPVPIERWFYQGGEPVDATDKYTNTGVGLRANFWVAYKYGMDQTTPSLGDPNPVAPAPGGVWDWEADMWATAYGSCSGNPYTTTPGSGIMLYPGNKLSCANPSGSVEASILPQNLDINGFGNTNPGYGGITGPVASMRMEQWRRGYEDYEYLYLLGHKGCPTAPAQCNRAAVLTDVVDSMGGAYMTSGGSGTTSWQALNWQNVDPRAFLSGVWPITTPGFGSFAGSTTSCIDSTFGAGGLAKGLPNGPTGAAFSWDDQSGSGISCPGEWTNNPNRYAAMRVALATDLGWVTGGMPPAATPTFSPAAGTYTSAQTVTINDTTPNPTIYYTTDGTTPTTSSSVYSGPITVSSTETVEAIATATGYATSAIGSAAFTINSGASPTATPTFSPAAGTYTSAQTVTINDTTPNPTIYYTTDGTTPTTSSPVYTAGSIITVSTSEKIEAIATAPGYTQSAVGTAVYTITAPPPVTYTVTDTTDSATDTGSIRYIVNEVDAGSGGDTIVFSGAGASGTITLTNGTLNLSQNVTITGPGANLLTVSGNKAVTVFSIGAGVTASISGLTIANGSNTATGIGGGIVVNSGSMLTVSNSTLSGNSAKSQGGGIANNGGTVIVSSSTLSNNTANGGQGGGILNGGGGMMTLDNSTITGSWGYTGGAGILDNGTSLTVSNSTITGNTSYDGSGGGISVGGGTVTITNSIVAGNTDMSSQVGEDCVNCGTQSTNNLISTSTSVVNPMLGSLQNNGGPTQTMLPQTGSPALSAGLSSTLPTDQRGDPRPTGNGVVSDLGSVEVTQGTTPTPSSIAVSSGSGQSAVVNTAFANPLVVIVKDSSGNPVSGATVTFTAGTGIKVSSSTATTNSSGQASVTATPTSAGTSLTVTASVSGVSTPASFTETGTAATPAPQTITFPTIASQVYSGTPFTVQAPATASSGLPVTITVQSGSPATISGNTVTITGTGTVTLTATQAGNASYSAATPVTQSFTVTAATPPTSSFTLTANPTSLSIAPGGAGTTTLTVTPMGGYNGTLALTCTNLPINASCTFTQGSTTNNNVTLIGNNQPVNVTLTIQTNVAAMQTMPSPFGPQQSPLSPILPALAFWWPGSMAGLAAFGRKRNLSKARQRMLQLCLLVLMTGALAAGISGCGGTASGTAATHVTPAGPYTVTVTAAPAAGTGGTAQSVALTVTVQ